MAQSRRARCDAGGGGLPSDDVAAPAEVAVVKVRRLQIAGRRLLRSRMVVLRLSKEAAESTLMVLHSCFVLQIDGNALSRRQAERFDSNMPHQHPHTL